MVDNRQERRIPNALNNAVNQNAGVQRGNQMHTGRNYLIDGVNRIPNANLDQLNLNPNQNNRIPNARRTNRSQEKSKTRNVDQVMNEIRIVPSIPFAHNQMQSNHQLHNAEDVEETKFDQFGNAALPSQS